MKLQDYADQINLNLKNITKLITEYTKIIEDRLPQKVYDNLRGFDYKFGIPNIIGDDIYLMFYIQLSNTIYRYYTPLELRNIIAEVCNTYAVSDFSVEPSVVNNYADIIIEIPFNLYGKKLI